MMQREQPSHWKMKMMTTMTMKMMTATAMKMMMTVIVTTTMKMMTMMRMRMRMKSGRPMQRLAGNGESLKCIRRKSMIPATGSIITQGLRGQTTTVITAPTGIMMMKMSAIAMRRMKIVIALMNGKRRKMPRLTECA
jgi:hypothetical protein